MDTKDNVKLPSRHYTYPTMKYFGDLHFHFYHEGATLLHSHDYFELFVITKGTARHTFEIKDELLEEGCVRLISPNQQHQFHATEERSVHFNIAIPADTFGKLCEAVDESALSTLEGGNNIYKLAAEEFSYIKYLADMAYTSEDKHGTVIAKVIVENLIMYLLHYHAIKNDEPPEYPAWIQTFCEKVMRPENFLKPISELYKLVPYSQPVLNAHFKRHTGETLISFITKKKMNYASNLLKFSDYSILEISERATYNSLSHFNHTFKKYMGYTPSEYRKLFGKKV